MKQTDFFDKSPPSAFGASTRVRSKIAHMPGSGSVWKPTKLSELPSWENAKRVGIDTETCDPHLRTLGSGVGRTDSYLVGFSFSIEQGNTYYIPLKHEAGGNLDITHAAHYLQAQAAFFTGELVGMNLQYDLDWLSHDLGVTFSRVSFFRDIGIADPLIYELHNRYNMNAIAERCGVSAKDEIWLETRAKQLGLHPKRDLWRMHSEDVGAYAEYDAKLPILIYEKQRELLAKHDLMDIWELESRTLPVLLTMRQRGVRIDQDKLAMIEKYTRQEETTYLHEIHRLTGIHLDSTDVWKTAALVPVFTAIGITLPKTDTDKPSFKKEDALNYSHPVAQLVQQARGVNKIRTTFVRNIRNHMIDGRIHCTFNQIARENEEGNPQGARYGRLSASNPNLQNQPSKGALGSMWREIYIPEGGAIWNCNDMSQQEARWTNHFATLLHLPRAAETAAMYRTDPNADNYTMVAKLTNTPRNQAKTIYLGLCYGEGGAKLSKSLGLSTRWCTGIGNFKDRQTFYFPTEEEAREFARGVEADKFVYEAAGEEGQLILDQFNERCPFVKLLAKAAQRRAQKVGYIVTIGKRRLHFPEKYDGSGYDFVYRALNRLIQGSAADQMKKAAVLLHEEMPGLYMQLQVHDELDSSVESPEQAVQAAKIMREAYQAAVPFKVDVELGENWGSLRSLEEFIK